MSDMDHPANARHGLARGVGSGLDASAWRFKISVTSSPLHGRLAVTLVDVVPSANQAQGANDYGEDPLRGTVSCE